MLTLFSIPKAFRGQIAIAQCNAIQSWLQLHAEAEVILFGDEEGTAEVCKQFGLRHEQRIPVWTSGVPLFWGEATRRIDLLARHKLICHVNADIILTSDLIRAVNLASHFDRFLLTGRRYDHLINEPVDFGDPEWELRLRGLQVTWTKGMDYFVYPKGLWGKVPPFIAGRPYTDNWLIYHARKLAVPVIDATQFIPAVHQSHPVDGRGHTPDEIAWNRKLAGIGVYFNTDDATHLLTPAGLQHKPRYWRTLVRSLDSALLIKSPRLYPILSLARYRRCVSPWSIVLMPWRIIHRAVRLVKDRGKS